MDNVLADLIIHQKDMQSAKYLDFADAVSAVLGGENMEALYGQVNTDQKNFIQSTFTRYIDNGWELISDDTTHSIGIMVFKKGNKTEIICITSDGLRAPVKFNMGSSILGQTKSDKFVDSTKVLSALHGNLVLMKAMIYVSQHNDLFKNLPISEIKAINP